MIRKTIILICFLLCLFILCPNLTLYAISNPAEEDAGYALLDSLVVTFKELAEMRESVVGNTGKALKRMMSEAKKAKAQNQIDAVFYKRYTRILMILKIVITPIDDSGIMGPLFFREINQFIEDIEGVEFDVQRAGPNVAINTLSQAVSHEVINLRIYLDNKEKREKLTEQYQEKMAISKDTSELAEKKDKQLMSMKDIATISQALTDYVTDMGVPPKQSGIHEWGSKFYEALVPFYVKNLPIKDKWGNAFRVYCGEACNGVYEGIKGCKVRDFIIISYGRDGKKENWKYDSKNPAAGLYEVKAEGDFDKDLVMRSGTWIRAPKLKGKK